MSKTEKKGAIDSLFDIADKVVDGVANVLRDAPEPEGEDSADSGDDYSPGNKRVIDVPSQPLFKSGPERDASPKKPPREVTITVRNISKRRNGGVTILAELPTHEIVAIQLSEADWKKVCDDADWMRMVQD